MSVAIIPVDVMSVWRMTVAIMSVAIMPVEAIAADLETVAVIMAIASITVASITIGNTVRHTIHRTGHDIIYQNRLTCAFVMPVRDRRRGQAGCQ